jgi:cytochrome b561
MAIIFIAAWLIGFYSGNFLSYDADGSFKGMSLPYIRTLQPRLFFWW